MFKIQKTFKNICANETKDTSGWHVTTYLKILKAFLTFS